MQSSNEIEKPKYGALAQTSIWGLTRIFIIVNANSNSKIG